MPNPSSRIANITPAGKDGWEVHFSAMARRQSGEDIVMLSVGDHDFDTPTETIEACVTAVRSGFHHYTQLAGIPALREAMARISTHSTGVATRPEQVVATPGGQLALYAAIQATMDPGEHGVVIAPHYATYPATFRAAEATYSIVEAASQNGFLPRLQDIEMALQPHSRALLINTPNNPTGAVYSRDCLEGIAELCRARDLWLISDEVYWSLGGERGSGREHVSPRALAGMEERTLVINSMSKSHAMTGWRIGWLTGPQEIISKIVSLNLVTTYGLTDFVSRAAVEALNNDYGVAETAIRYAARRHLFLEKLGNLQHAAVRGSEGGMYVMLDISALERDCEAFAWTLLDQEKISVMPGASFGDAAKGHIRISLCQPDDILASAADRIRHFINNYEKQKR